jgi:endoglucanase
MRHRPLLLALLIVLLSLAAIDVAVIGRSADRPNIAGPATTPTSTSSSAAVPRSSAGALGLRVEGNHLVDGAGKPIRLLGVNRSGTEYSCIDGNGLFDGPNDDPSVAAIAAWHANAVRVPLNEDCWLAINGVKPAYAGPNYQGAIVDYVKLLHQHNLYAILDLHWNAPAHTRASQQQPMPDADHAPAFWQSVAATFKDDPAVVFDLYNEPHDVDWSCWRNGCGSPGWQTAGMQNLVDVVRRAGARQPIMLAGIDWANDLSQWLQYMPSDPAHALVASFHLYDSNPCRDSSCWSSTLLPVARRVPLVTGEVGEADCSHAFIDSYMTFADLHQISYMAWVWDTWGCGGRGIALISSYDGTPTTYGVGVRSHLLLIN